MPVEPATAATPDDVDATGLDEKGVALCLSGGGYRAMLFHVGTLWRLNELGLQELERSHEQGGSRESLFGVLERRDQELVGRAPRRVRQERHPFALGHEVPLVGQRARRESAQNAVPAPQP